MKHVAAASEADATFTLDDALLRQRKTAAARRFNTVQIPALRGVGFVIVCAIVMVLDLRSDPAFPQVSLAVLVAVNLGYAAAAWPFMRFAYGRLGRVDPGLVLFHLDVVVWLVDLHYIEQGANHLFFASFLLVRVVDQVGFGFRRAIYFLQVVTAAYLAYCLWIAWTEPAATYWPDRLGVTAIMYLLGLYFAATGLVTERLRRRARQAIHAARSLVANLESQALALHKQASELERARAQAAQANAAKSQFLAVTSHEIRTPMNGILGATELLIGTPLTPTQQRYVRTAHRSASALLALIDDVLDLSRIEAGRLALHASNVDLRALVSEAVDLVRMTARDKAVEVSGRVDTALPQRVHADPLRLRQLLVNLLQNAVKFTEHGSVRLDVTVVTADPLAVRLSVSDTGIGIPPAQIGSIFDAFTQVDSSSTRRHGGTGLGLTIVKELAELMGGSLGVESVVGEGSRFWVDLPLKQAPDARPVIDRVDDSEDETSIRVLVAEDDPVNQQVVTAMLERLGCEVQVVDDGAAAIRSLQDTYFDLVFMDCHMPGMDGYEATRSIRAAEQGSGRRVAIVALTADALASDRERGLASGMDDFLTKPASSVQLSQVIERWTGRRTNPATQW